jgi:CheY-like chemotaxis protein
MAQVKDAGREVSALWTQVCHRIGEAVPSSIAPEDSVVNAVAKIAKKPPPGRKTVMFVDDERANLLAFALEFEDSVDVVTASDAAEALMVLETRKVDAVVADVRMPGVSGHELRRRIAARWPGVPVHLMSAYDASPDVLPKPMDRARLLQLVGA